MHNCVIKIDNVEYLPVRAIPYCTSGHFDPSDVIHMLIDLESHSDSNFSANVVSYLHSEDNRLTYQPPNMLFKFENRLNEAISRNGSYIERLKALPAKMLVKVEEMLSFHKFLTKTAEDNEFYIFAKSHHSNFTWCSEPDMEEEEISVVFEGFESECKTEVKKSRKNSTTNNLEKMRVALEKIEAICNDAGIRFSRDHVPGQKKQLYECIKLLDPLFNTAFSTFDGPNYIDKLNLKWHQGERKELGCAMVNAVHKVVGVV